MSGGVWYLDSSAIVKLAVAEPESQALQAWRNELGGDDVLMTCELAVAEVLQVVRRLDGDVEVALVHLDALDQLVLDRDLMLAAAAVGPAGMRTLDAIHVSAALAAGDALAGIVTYDDRMAEAARGLGVESWHPAKRRAERGGRQQTVIELRGKLGDAMQEGCARGEPGAGGQSCQPPRRAGDPRRPERPGSGCAAHRSGRAVEPSARLHRTW